MVHRAKRYNIYFNNFSKLSCLSLIQQIDLSTGCVAHYYI